MSASQVFFFVLVATVVLVSGRLSEDFRFDSLEDDVNALSYAGMEGEGKGRKNWLGFSSVGTDVSESWNYHELYHNSDSKSDSKSHYKSRSDSSSSESHSKYDHHNMDCDKLRHIYEQESQKLRILNQICQMNITQYESLTDDCLHHLEEEQEDASDLADVVTRCEGEVKAMKLLIAAEKQKNVLCASTNAALDSKIVSQQKINSDFLAMNLGLADQLGFCQDDIYDCQSDINSCVDNCSGHHS